jgi:hypothetical protein
MIKNQRIQNLNAGLKNAFSKISMHSQYKLIGSSSIKNMLYNNDYDLNEFVRYKGLAHFIQTIFEECRKDSKYVILDFKAGETEEDEESIHWTYKQIKQGYQIIHNKRYDLEDCLKQQSATIKLDVCYILNNLFIDITNNYFINHTEETKKVVRDFLKDDVDELIEDNKYFKAIKRLFSIERLEGKTDTDLLAFLNSDYGRFYKVIHDLELVEMMSEQTFKKIDKNLLSINLESIKNFLSNVTVFEVNHIIDEINDIIKSKKYGEIEALVNRCMTLLNNKVESQYFKFARKIK